jgi:tetratricopeptide (TPR) repeat protein
MAYARGWWYQAVQAYSAGLQGAPHNADLLILRARAEFFMGAYPAALADLTEALTELGTIDQKDLVPVYDSKALLEYSVGVVHDKMGNRAEAREAFARALREDLSYYQAHVRLGALALADGDTVTAISEYDLAAQIQPRDPVVHYRLGALLVGTHEQEAAETHFKAAIAAEPLYPPPYAALGGIYEGLGQPGQALAQYRAFVAHARRSDPVLPWVLSRVEALKQEAVP